MKIRLFAKTLLAVLFCSSTFAGVDADRAWHNEHRMAFSVDPLIWTAGNISLQYEFSINDRLAINIPVRFGFDKVIFNNTYFENGSYFAPKVGVKYYITGKATHHGFYVNPLLGLFAGKVTGLKDTTAAFTYGFRFGYAWNIWKGLWLDSYMSYEALAMRLNSDEAGKSDSASVPSETNGARGSFAVPFNVGMMIGYNW
jgi:hypothetical protein